MIVSADSGESGLVVVSIVPPSRHPVEEAPPSYMSREVSSTFFSFFLTSKELNPRKPRQIVG